MKQKMINAIPCGFTLTELAIVLVILALLIGGMLAPLSAQRDVLAINTAQRQLGEIQEALIGFAAIHGHLPCPDTDADPNSPDYGVENTPCDSGAVTEGFLPWKTLGIPQVDPWGFPRTSADSPRTGDWRYRVDRNFTKPFTLTQSFSADDALVVQDHIGNALSANMERPLAIIYSAGPNLVADGENARYEPTNGRYEAGERTPAFDDMVIWIGRPILFNRMIAAGKLP